jgi:acyl-CoA dehydrogenase
VTLTVGPTRPAAADPPAAPTGPADLAGALADLRAAGTVLDTGEDPDGLALTVLARHRLMSLLVPVELGGPGAGPAGLVTAARELGAVSPAVAVMWVMHCQQVAVLDRYAPEPLRAAVLHRLVDRQELLASVTTEPGKGGHMLTAVDALDARGAAVRFTRRAPVVSGGSHAGGFLVTMRRSDAAVADDVVLVLCGREQAGAQVTGRLDMLGMRGTGNVAMTLDAAVPADHVIDPPGGFSAVAATTMAPLGHLGWVAAWAGAARTALRVAVETVRRGGPARRGDLVLARIARARARLDTVEALLAATLQEYTARLDRDHATLGAPEFQIAVNNLKVVGSEQAFAVADEALELTGLGGGYRRDAGPVERIFRDLRAATLMYSNDRLLLASGRLALVDRSATSFRTVTDPAPATTAPAHRAEAGPGTGTGPGTPGGSAGNGGTDG